MLWCLGKHVGHTAIKIKSLPSLGYERLFGTSRAKVSLDYCKFFMSEQKVSNLIYYFSYFIHFIIFIII